MRGLAILCAVLLVLFLLSLVRLGAWVEYSEPGLLVKIKLGPLRVQVLPRKPKKKREKKPEPELPTPQPQKRGGSLDLVKQLLPTIAEAAGRLKRKIRIDDFRMDLLWSSPDPAACALGFGAANAAVGMIWPLIEQNFKVKDRRIRTAVDFDLGKPTVYLLVCATLTIGQAVAFGIWAAIRLLSAYRHIRPTQKKENTTTEQKEAV